MNWNEAAAELGKPLDPRHVIKKPQGNFGPKGDYIEGWHAIAEANRIFGFDGWSYDIVSLERVSLVEGTDSRGNQQWQGAYTCIVRVRVGDVTREDVGFGSGFARMVGDAVEGATKEAVTDALKRALRTFGNPFGLALYDKSRANVRLPDDEPEAEQDPAALRDDLKAALTSCRTVQQLAGIWKQRDFQTAKASLPKPMQAELEAEKNRLKGALTNDPAMQAPAA